MAEPPPAIARRLADGIHNQAFNLRRTLLITGSDSNGAMSVWIEEVPGGAGPPKHLHRQEDETFHILSGRFRFFTGEDVHELGVGSFRPQWSACAAQPSRRRKRPRKRRTKW